MLQFTKRTEYALIALVHIAKRGGEFVSVREIGERYPLPKRLLAEVLKLLQHAGLVHSQLGATGGYRLARPASQLTLGQVVAAIEGAPALTSCSNPSETHSDGCEVEPFCPIRSPLQGLRQGIWALMQATTLQTLTEAAPLPMDVLEQSGASLLARQIEAPVANT